MTSEHRNPKVKSTLACQDHKNTSRYSSHFIPCPLFRGGRYNCFDVLSDSAVWGEIFSENDFSVLAARGCIDLHTCPSTSEVRHTTSNLVLSCCLTISLGRYKYLF